MNFLCIHQEVILDASITEYKLTGLLPMSRYIVLVQGERDGHYTSVVTTEFITGIVLYVKQSLLIYLPYQYFIITKSFFFFFPSLRQTAFPFPYWVLSGAAERSSAVRWGGYLPAGKRRTSGQSLLWHGDWGRRLDGETNCCYLNKTLHWRNGRMDLDNRQQSDVCF